MTADNNGRLGLMLLAVEDSNGEFSLQAVGEGTTFDTDVDVTSSLGTVKIVKRDGTRDVFVEVPQSTPKCGYNKQCADVPTTLVDATFVNSHPTESKTVRVSFSRNFETRDASLAPSSARR